MRQGSTHVKRTVVCLVTISALVGIGASVAWVGSAGSQPSTRHDFAAPVSRLGSSPRGDTLTDHTSRCRARPQTPKTKVSAAATAIAAAAISRDCFSTFFGGVELTGQGSHVVVYLTQLSPAAEKVIIGRGPAREFTFRKTSRSLAFLTELQDRISHAWAALRRAGINIVSVGVRNPGRLDVTVQDLTPAKARLLDHRYGAANLDLHSTPQPYGGTLLPLRIKPPGSGR